MLHQLKEPLSSITSLCTEPVLSRMRQFLQRHIPLDSSRALKSVACLEFWVLWHSFLNEMRFPIYRIEDVEIQDIFQISGLAHLYLEEPLNISTKSNHRSHRSKFSWQELYTMDQGLAAKAWELAAYYGYSYPYVDFDSLTCLDYLPLCTDADQSTKAYECPYGTHPYPTNLSSIIIPAQAADDGFKGWIDSGCVEYKTPWSSRPYVGIRGLLGDDDLQTIHGLNEELFLQINTTVVPKRLPVNMSVSRVAFSQSSYDPSSQNNLWPIINNFIGAWVTSIILLRCICKSRLCGGIKYIG